MQLYTNLTHTRVVLRQGAQSWSCLQSSLERLSKYRQINSEGCKLWVKEESMKPIRVPDLAPEQLAQLEELYRSTRNVRLRTRAQMVLLAAERRLTAAQISEIVRASDETVRVHLKSAGIVLSRPQHTITSPDPEYALKKRRSRRLATASTLQTTSTTLTSST